MPWSCAIGCTAMTSYGEPSIRRSEALVIAAQSGWFTSCRLSSGVLMPDPSMAISSEAENGGEASAYIEYPVT